MARSGNLHTLRELTAETGEGFLYRRRIRRTRPRRRSSRRANMRERPTTRSFHGNAIVSNLRLERPHLIPLEESGFWFPGQDGAQRRIGGRMALAARLVDAPFPLWVVTVHLESKTDPEDRQLQVQALLRGLDTLRGGRGLHHRRRPQHQGLPSGDAAQARRWPRRPSATSRCSAISAGRAFPGSAPMPAAVTQRTGPSGDPDAALPQARLDFRAGRHAGKPTDRSRRSIPNAADLRPRDAGRSISPSTRPRTGDR